MLKAKNIIPNFCVILVLLIIYVSTIPTYIKLLLAIFSVSFLIPNAREIMYENRLRKVKVAFYTSFIFSLGFTVVSIIAALPSFDIANIAGFLLILFFSSIGVFCYGIPASIIAELVSKRYLEYRALVSGLIHIGFGLFTAIFSLVDYLNPSVFILPTICSIIFYLIDEVTRRRLKESHSNVSQSCKN
ncbi:hypothetical protein [Bacillus sp. EB01]|uniref:hypothetical protein n=1 Tax=Bacillus sp. EB01 TaxID=1347086 RepID=UPI0005C6F10F|nr:hypothetical protein [Bacillus sp. EB01]